MKPISLPDQKPDEILTLNIMDDRWVIEYRDRTSGDVRWAKLLPAIDPPMKPVHLNEAQIRYLHYGPSIDGDVRPQGDLIIRDAEEGMEGWILVGDPADEEESGVWVDSHGHEHYGGE